MWCDGALVITLCGFTFELCDRHCENCPKCNIVTTNKTEKGERENDSC